MYDPIIGRFTTIDPARQYYSPFLGMGNNPIGNVDPTGAVANPIYDINTGDFLGTDDRGLQGEAIFMDPDAFTQGMAHSQAMRSGFTFDELWNMGYNMDILNLGRAHFVQLPLRPDYDGFLTIDEGVAWAHAHPGALDNPTPDNMVYLDASQLDFGNISSENLDLNEITPVNLFNSSNTRASVFNSTLRATVYALGRVNLRRVHGTAVEVINDEATDYDWNLGGSRIRRIAISAERARTGLNDTHGFRAYYFGLGNLNK